VEIHVKWVVVKSTPVKSHETHRKCRIALDRRSALSKWADSRLKVLALVGKNYHEQVTSTLEGDVDKSIFI
jgi:hypothetical protein